jgi:hypothetical protein
MTNKKKEYKYSLITDVTSLYGPSNLNVTEKYDIFFNLSFPCLRTGN